MRTTSAATGHTVSRSFPAPERAVSSSTRCRKTVCLAFSFSPAGRFRFSECRPAKWRIDRWSLSFCGRELQPTAREAVSRTDNRPRCSPGRAVFCQALKPLDCIRRSHLHAAICQRPHKIRVASVLGRNRPQPASIHPNIPRPSGPHTESFLSCTPIPTHTGDGTWSAGVDWIEGGTELRILRPGPFHPRFSGVFWLTPSQYLARATEHLTTSQSC